MHWIEFALRKFAGLFVDDGRLALMALIWLIVCGLAMRRPPVDLAWMGVALFVGLALALLTSSLRTRISHAGA